jgi:thiamine biosynthesis lipoprotein
MKTIAIRLFTLLLPLLFLLSVTVEAGRDMRVQGERAPGKKWKVSIKHPRKKGNLATLPLKNLSISTSGDYERFFIKNGKLYHHIIDPKIG